MSSIFDDPFFIATINAQTRAMNKFDGRTVELDRHRVRKLYLDVASLSRGEDMERIIEFVLDLNAPYINKAERGGYKIAIGMAMHEVSSRKNQQLRELEGRSVPLYVYEQEM